MGVGFDLESGVGDPIFVLEDAASPVEDRVGIGGGAGHEMDGGHVHLGGEGPHVEIVNVDHTMDRAEFGLKPVEVEAGRCGLDEELLDEGDRFRMSEEMLDGYFRQLIDLHQTPQVTVAWQGGEPALMGVDYYRKAMLLEERYRKPGMSFSEHDADQRHLLTDEWCEFFAENDFLIGGGGPSRTVWRHTR